MYRQNESEISQKLYQIIQQKLREKYGREPDLRIQKRVEEEWHAAERSNSVVDLVILWEITYLLKEWHFPWRMRGCSGSSFLLYLLQITSGNPLPAHSYYMSNGTVHWNDQYRDGFDIPRNEVDGELICHDGHNIPWQSLWGYGEQLPVFDIDLPECLFELMQTELQTKRFRSIDSDIIPNVPYPGRVKMIKLRNISILFTLREETVPLEFFQNIMNEERGVPNWKQLIGYRDEMNITNPPKTFADLCSVFGLIHSTGAWDKEAQKQCDNCGYGDLISDRESVYEYLLKHGFLEKDAWMGMKRVQMGHPLPVVTEEMLRAEDAWVVGRCQNVKYLFPRAHAVEWILYQVKIHDF